MKICLVTPGYPPRPGGVETHVRHISERLVDLGHGVTVLTADAGGLTASVETRGGVTVRRHPAVAPGGAYEVAPGIVRSVRRVEADVVHAHNYHSLSLLLAALGVDGERFVVTPHYHGRSASTVRTRLLSLYAPVGGWALHRADAAVAVSGWERDALRADFGVDATVLPNGVERERFEGATPERRERPFLLSVGRLEAYKGVQFAIRALPALPEWKLVVAGSGPYRRELERTADAGGVADRVSFLGHVEDGRLPGLLAGADVLLALSDFEAYGMTVAESIAAGTPCVVHEAGALREWTADPGVVGVADRSPGTLAEAVLRARNQVPDGSQLIDWDTVVERLVDQYESH
jgi:glycosyltransferase involved in cell wall biosynthesis